MLVQSHDTSSMVERQALALVEDAWATEVVPRLPANLTEQARALKAFQRVRGLATPPDLLRGVLAGRMHQVDGTDRRGGEHLERYRWHAGEVIVADRGYGYRRSVATAVRQQADVVVRIHPATFPLETEAGQAFNVLRWLRQRGGAEREWQGWCRWVGQRYPVRLVAAKLDPTATRRARRRARRKAQKDRRPSPRPP